MCMRSFTTIGCEMKRPWQMENLITTTSVAIGDPFPGLKSCTYVIEQRLEVLGELVEVGAGQELVT